MLYAFDLDGTLADTREAVTIAYRSVGVEPPPDFFGKPWREWLTDAALHEAKNQVYREIAPHYIKPTPLVKLFKLTGGMIITGASAEAANVVLRALHLSRPRYLYTQLNMQDKANVLNLHGEEGIVFEDSITIADYLKEKTRWTVCRVHY
jgi:hypothetical protein